MTRWRPSLAVMGLGIFLGAQALFLSQWSTPDRRPRWEGRYGPAGLRMLSADRKVLWRLEKPPSLNVGDSGSLVVKLEVSPLADSKAAPGMLEPKTFTVSVEGPFDWSSPVKQEKRLADGKAAFSFLFTAKEPGTKAITVRFSTDASATSSVVNSRGESCNGCDFYTYELPVGERTMDTVKMVASASMSVLGPLLTVPYWIDFFRKRREKTREDGAAKPSA